MDSDEIKHILLENAEKLSALKAQMDIAFLKLMEVEEKHYKKKRKKALQKESKKTNRPKRI